MEHTHEYDCIVCGAHFDDSRSLDWHNREKHLKNAAGMEVPRHANVEGSGPLERGADEEGPPS